jgi:hypothetical protein
VFDAKLSNRFSNVTRLVGIKRLRLSLAHSAKAAMPCANIAENHEGRGAFAPALKNVGAASFLTNRVQAQVIDHPIHAFESFVSVNPDLEPFRSWTCEFRLSHREYDD